MSEFTGKYKAYVQDVNDPEKRFRIKVTCPAVHKDYVSAWCEPCFPISGDRYVPTVGDCVWIEFTNGNVNRPVWVGQWYAKGEVDGSTDERAISYGGAEILLKNGVFYVNGVDVLKEIEILKSGLASQMEHFTDEIERLDNRIDRLY